MCAMSLTACMHEGNEDGKMHAVPAGESVKKKWQTSRKTLEVELSAYEGQTPSRIGVYAEYHDATAEERESINGIPFVRSNGNTYTPENSSVITGDTTAIFRICSPYTAGLMPEDTLKLEAPFESWLYGNETGRAITDDVLKIKMDLQHSTSMVRLRLESEDMRKTMTEAVLEGSNIYTAGDYIPYSGIWINLRGNGCPVKVTMDKRMSRYNYIDFVIPPSAHAGDVKISITADGKDYIARTTLPRLGRGEMTQLNMLLSEDCLRITSSWIETNRGLRTESAGTVDTVAVGDYLMPDGRTVSEYSPEAIGVVMETDGTHGKAVAMKDMEGLVCFGKGEYSSGTVFASIDRQKAEGYINPSGITATDEELRIVYTPEMDYPEDCAIGYDDGCLLGQELKLEKKEWDKDEIAAYITRTDAAYIPSLGELVKLYYMLNPYKGEVFSPEGFSRPSGVYTSVSESSEDSNYIMDFDTGLASGNVSKKTRLKLRLFYLF